MSGNSTIHKKSLFSARVIRKLKERESEIKAGDSCLWKPNSKEEPVSESKVRKKKARTAA